MNLQLAAKLRSSNSPKHHDDSNDTGSKKNSNSTDNNHPNDNRNNYNQDYQDDNNHFHTRYNRMLRIMVVFIAISSLISARRAAA